jgi:cell division septum initiation protein DivIVA
MRTFKDESDYVAHMRHLTGTVGTRPDDEIQNLYTSDDELADGCFGSPLPAHLLPFEPAGNGCGYMTESDLIAAIDFKAGNPIEVEDSARASRLMKHLEAELAEMEDAVAAAEREAEEKVEAKTVERRVLNARIAEFCREHKRLNRNGSQASRLDREIRRKCGEHKGLMRQGNFRAARKVAKEISSLKRQFAAEQDTEVVALSRLIADLKERLAVIDENLPAYKRLMTQALRLANQHLDKVCANLRAAEDRLFLPEPTAE